MSVTSPRAAQKDDASYIPKYSRLAGSLRKQILSKELIAGSRLPSILELATLHDTTKVTVCKAIAQLEQEGLLSRIHGRGTFVCEAKPRTIGIVFDLQIFEPTVTPFYLTFLRDFEKVCSSANLRRKIFINTSCNETAGEFLEAIKNRDFDDLIVCSKWVVENRLRTLEKSGIRCVGMYPYDGMNYWVFSNSYLTGLKGVHELSRLGCRNIGFIGTSKRDFLELSTNDAIDGYCTGLREAGLFNEPKIYLAPTIDAKTGYDGFCHLWKKSNSLDGLVITDEAIARGVIRAMVEKGVNCPDDLIIASQVTEGAQYMFAVPVVELRTPVQHEVEIIMKILDDLYARRPITNPKVFAEPDVYNPFADGKEFK